jgi:hypothetical protein
MQRQQQGQLPPGGYGDPSSSSSSRDILGALEIYRRDIREKIKAQLRQLEAR